MNNHQFNTFYKKKSVSQEVSFLRGIRGNVNGNFSPISWVPHFCLFNKLPVKLDPIDKIGICRATETSRIMICGWMDGWIKNETSIMN